MMTGLAMMRLWHSSAERASSDTRTAVLGMPRSGSRRDPAVSDCCPFLAVPLDNLVAVHYDGSSRLRPGKRCQRSLTACSASPMVSMMTREPLGEPGDVRPLRHRRESHRREPGRTPPKVIWD